MAIAAFELEVCLTRHPNVVVDARAAATEEEDAAGLQVWQVDADAVVFAGKTLLEQVEVFVGFVRRLGPEVRDDIYAHLVRVVGTKGHIATGAGEPQLCLVAGLVGD